MIARPTETPARGRPRSAVLVTGAVVALLAGGALWWWLALGREAQPPALSQPIRAGRYYWPGEYWLDIAQHKGWFKEAGLAVELVDTNDDYYGSLKELAAGRRLDTHGLYLFDLVIFDLEGADLVMVLASDQSSGVEALVARGPIRRIGDLRGKTVAVPRGTFLEYFLSAALAREGLRLDQVRLLDRVTEKLPAELAAGSLDAIVTWEPGVTEAVDKARGRRLLDSSQVPGLSPSGFVFKRDFIARRPQDVEAFARVWRRTTAFIKEKPGEAFAIIASIYGKPVAEVEALARIDLILDLRDNLTAFSYAAGLESLHGAARQINDFLVEQGRTTKRLDTADLLDSRFIRRLR